MCRDPSVDVAALRVDGTNILIGTPGRIDDILQRCSFLNLRSFEVLVLDEADRLLDMGFRKQLDAIMARLPRQRRTGLYSATQTEAVEALARAGLRNPVRVAVAVTSVTREPNGEEHGKEQSTKKRKGGDAHEEACGGGTQQQVTPSSLRIQYSLVDPGAKISQLAAFLAEHIHEKVIVYFLTCACVDYFAVALPRLPNCKRIPISSLHGRMKQSARESTLQAFASSPTGVLFATDVAARGLDIPDVHWVLQYDAPQDPAAFVHRCGRTARMGRSGRALAYLTPEELPYVDFLRVRKIPLTEVQPLKEEFIDGGPLALLRLESENDRLLMEHGTKAFVSYIRAYKEHQCKYIFRMDELKLGLLASAFALLRLPRMPEVKRAAREAAAGSLEGFRSSTVDPETVKFKDKSREKQRQALLKQRAAASAPEKAEENKAVNRAKSHGGTNAAAQQQQQSRLTAAKRRQLEARQEYAELNDEYSLLKKLKKGKISQKQYDVATGLTSDEEDEAAGGVVDDGASKHPYAGSIATERSENSVSKIKEIALGAQDLVAEALRKKTRKAKKKRRRERQQDLHARAGT